MLHVPKEAIDYRLGFLNKLGKQAYKQTKRVNFADFKSAKPLIHVPFSPRAPRRRRGSTAVRSTIRLNVLGVTLLASTDKLTESGPPCLAAESV